MSWSIRETTSSDYEAIVRVVNSEVVQYAQMYSAEELHSIGIGEFSVADLVSVQSERKYIVAQEGGDIIGFASWYIKPNGVAWLSMLEVLPGQQGRGVGTSLLSYYEHAALVKGGKAFAFEVQAKAVWAHKFYEKAGYVVLSEQDLTEGIFANTLRSSRVVLGTRIYGKALRNNC